MKDHEIVCKAKWFKVKHTRGNIENVICKRQLFNYTAHDAATYYIKMQGELVKRGDVIVCGDVKLEVT